uniref:Uncharacterized protein n=1 Tax=Ciona intestinalis TaxID=7719 RepID=H2Y3M8_CIOIN
TIKYRIHTDFKPKNIEYTPTLNHKISNTHQL